MDKHQIISLISENEMARAFDLMFNCIESMEDKTYFLLSKSRYIRLKSDLLDKHVDYSTYTLEMNKLICSLFLKLVEEP